MNRLTRRQRSGGRSVVNHKYKVACMLSRRSSSFAFAVALGLTGLLARPGFAANPPGPPPANSDTATQSYVFGVTAPSKEANLSFRMQDVIRDVPVVEGQHVKAGDVLVQLDDRQEQAELNSEKIEADSDLPQKDAQKKLDAANVELDRQKDMQAQNVASEVELRKAQLDVDIAAIELDGVKQEQQERKEKARKQELHVAEMAMRAKIDGIVKTINVHPGEVVDPTKPAVIMVSIDPLWVEFYLPVPQAQALKDQPTLSVSYDKSNWSPAKLVYISPVAEPGTDLIKVRCEWPNPDEHSAGQQVSIRLPASIVGAAASTGSSASTGNAASGGNSATAVSASATVPGSR